MKGPTFIFFGVLLIVLVSVAALSIILMRQLFPIYKKPQIMRIFYLLTSVSIFALFLGRGWLDKLPFAGDLMLFIVIWFVSLTFLIVFSPAAFVVKKIIIQIGKDDGARNLSRRQFLKTAGVAMPILAAGCSSYGTFYSSRNIVDVKHEIFLADLDQTLSGFTIAQLSDVHLGWFFSIDKLKRTLDHIAAQKPDVLAVTGDLFDDVDTIVLAAQTLELYVEQFPQGIYFVWGNHEYMRGIPQIEAALKNTRVTVLKNANDLLAKATRPLYFIGVDYPMERDTVKQAAECQQMLETALDGIPTKSTKILLSHHSILIDNAFDHKIDLTMTGHTHGGQIVVLGMPIFQGFKYMRGMYKKEALHGYVNSGAGSWFPFRFGCPPEITFFTLKKEV